jgi:UDP-N-acetylmuramoyl-L-alanyl-D-glutamate--2,6-diaminopimelate ligase
MKLSKVIEILDPVSVSQFSEREIGHITFDSREVREKTLFFALPGDTHDGHEYIPEAVSRGAVACVVERRVDDGSVPLLEVRDSRESLARVAAHFFGFPSQELSMVGITGTNGKTTTAFLIRHVLEFAGRRAGLIGTLGSIIGERMMELPNTTPESLVLQRILRSMVEARLEVCVMEVSSHGIKLGRIRYIDFDFGILTNISRDHLDFHSSFDEYVETKLQFFTELKKGAVAFINQDARESMRFIEGITSQCRIYGMNGAPDFRGKVLKIGDEGMELRVAYAGGDQRIVSSLRGRFNAYNIVAAFACLLSLGVGVEEICEGIRSFPGVPGRAQRIETGLGFACVIDYAHTPDALFNIFSAERELTEGKLICVFGAGGDRDRGKRPEMGRVAAELCDVVILTSDNPRSEPPEAIIRDIQTGMDSKEVIVEEDRRKAIETSLAMASQGDTVVIAGKGHEKYQDIKGEKAPFSDVEYATMCIEKKRRARDEG